MPVFVLQVTKLHAPWASGRHQDSLPAKVHITVTSRKIAGIVADVPWSKASSVLGPRTRNRKVAGSSPSRRGGIKKNNPKQKQII